MKFQDPNMHDSRVTVGIKSVTNERTNGRTDGQAQSNMPHKRFFKLVHKNSRKRTTMGEQMSKKFVHWRYNFSTVKDIEMSFCDPLMTHLSTWPPRIPRSTPENVKFEMIQVVEQYESYFLDFGNDKKKQQKKKNKRKNVSDFRLTLVKTG